MDVLMYLYQRRDILRNDTFADVNKHPRTGQSYIRCRSRFCNSSTLNNIINKAYQNPKAEFGATIDHLHKIYLPHLIDSEWILLVFDIQKRILGYPLPTAKCIIFKLD